MSTIKLLLVEDDLTDQMSFARFVKKQQLPYDYKIAGSLAEAKVALQESQFDIVLTDHALGDGTSFDLLEHIPQSTPVIFVTGTGNEGIAVEAMKQGASDYLTKDIDGNYLTLLPLTIDSVIKNLAVQEELENYRNNLESLVEARTLELNQEVVERKKIEQQLIEEKERILVTLRSIGDAVITTDMDGNVEFINPVAESLTGWNGQEATGHALEDIFNIIHEETRLPAPNPVLACLKVNKIQQLPGNTLLISKDQQEFCIQDSAAPIHDKSGKPVGAVLVFSDMTESRTLSRDLAYQASHDPLTGLINRREFELRLKRILNSQKEAPSHHAFCYLDLDQFKVVNDTCGHTAGDELLKQIAAILHSKVSVRDTLARLGGDEFGILMEHCSLEQAEPLANALREAIADYQFSWEDNTFRIAVSIGLIPINHSYHNLNDLLIKGDEACYAAKDGGRNRVYIYKEDDEELAQRSGQMQWVTRLNRALDKDSFRLFRQTIDGLSEQSGEHFEVLIRIEEEPGEFIPPGAFLPAAERYGLMPKIDRLVIRKTFQWFTDHPEALSNLSLCSINLSGETVSAEWILDFISEQLEKHGLPANKFCFEITETAAISNLVQATAFIAALHEKGCQFALDDFGSGLSSFAYLKNLPVDYLKIDGAFVRDIGNDPIDLAMVKSINDIGQLMGKKTIAEFVEDEIILNKLKTIGVDFAQGYFIERPIPLAD